MQEDKYISGEQYRRQQQGQRDKRPSTNLAPIAWVVGGIVLIGVCFFGYIHYHTNANNPEASSGTASSQQASGAPTPGGGQATSAIGTITAFSATSITVQPSSGGSAETFTVTSTTQMQSSPSVNPGSYNVSSLQDGQTVTILSATGSNQAMGILLFAQSSSTPMHYQNNHSN